MLQDLCWNAKMTSVFAFPGFRRTAKIEMFISGCWRDTCMLKKMCVGGRDWKEF